MGFKLSKRSLSRLEGVHPFLADTVKRAIIITPVDFAVIEGVRTEARQRKLVQAGASRTMKSQHLIGHAVDIAPYIGGRIAWDWPLFYPLAAAMARATHEILEDFNALQRIKDRVYEAIARHEDNADEWSEFVQGVRWGGYWGALTDGCEPPTARVLEDRVAEYINRRRKAGKSAFIDGPHFEILNV